MAFFPRSMESLAGAYVASVRGVSFASS